LTTVYAHQIDIVVQPLVARQPAILGRDGDGYRLADGIGLLAGQAEGLGGIPDRADLLAEGNIARMLSLRKPPKPVPKPTR